MVHEIYVSDSVTPTGTMVSPGDTVRWILQSGTHRIISDPSSPKPFSSEELSVQGQQFQVAFHYDDGPGPFPYHPSDQPEVADTIFVPDECLAEFDLNGNGTPLEIADAVLLSTYLAGYGSIPDRLYQADINGDCVVDAADLEMAIRIEQGSDDVPSVWPVPTCCFPSIEIGACCVDGVCSVRSETNCEAFGGSFLGIGIWCRPDNPCPCCLNRGDINHDGELDLPDLICGFENLFLSGTPAYCDISCPDEADFNNDGRFDLVDLIRLMFYIFLPGAPAPAPCAGT